ncbi:MAG: sn-glycerol-3-phosphate ABC transporter ATP-binding protein UgpC [Intrasporangium sp.]|uniref:ABC transporter ATP-binding protein n=1 Tax=Intrasporangium sp. TaxID=1925024 RepID=UPI0026472DC3|nr:sn-glycerol-3-phosphate ABC transporter ATP-binding protein UgpC [Intrasporangium sp.]MDN5794973.1 sn-glycerol-3-phosphate ABC transporter ATP-binding protein UgpC [Intrasporangium sp.]
MAEVRLDGVGKVYADGTRAVTDLNLQITEGEFLVLVGPSGCGKTTALRMVAGLEEISEGTVTIGDRVVNRVPSRDRDVAMVFQSYALYPHLSVRDNIAFGLQLRKMPKGEINRRVQHAAEILGLTDHLDRKPRNLSGGQRQRVAMGRAIVREPQAFLMDEPLSNLDAKLRVQMRAEIARLQRDLGVTTIYVTHDQTEAMTLGDRVAVMSKGLLQQVDHPQALYDNPVNLFVAGFIGSPAMNLMRARLERDGGLAVILGSQRLEVPDTLLTDHPGLEDRLGHDVVVGIRPEEMDDADLDGATRDVLTSKAELVEAMGSDVMVHFSVDAPRVVHGEDPDLDLEADAPGLGGGDADHTIVIARCNPRTRAREGEPVRISVDTTRLHYFDPETGVAIRSRASEPTQTESRKEA